MGGGNIFYLTFTSLICVKKKGFYCTVLVVWTDLFCGGFKKSEKRIEKSFLWFFFDVFNYQDLVILSWFWLSHCIRFSLPNWFFLVGFVLRVYYSFKKYELISFVWKEFSSLFTSARRSHSIKLCSRFGCCMMSSLLFSQKNWHSFLAGIRVYKYTKMELITCAIIQW